MLRAGYPATGRSMRAWLKAPAGSNRPGLSTWPMSTPAGRPGTTVRRVRTAGVRPQRRNGVGSRARSGRRGIRPWVFSSGRPASTTRIGAGRSTRASSIGRSTGVLRRALRHSRAQRHLLPDAGGEAFRGLARRGPGRVRFAVKASRYLTHIRRLVDPQAPVDYLMERASMLGDRLGRDPAPAAAVARDRPGAARARRSRRSGARCRVAVEPRHKSWFVPELCACFDGTRRRSCWPTGAGRSRRCGRRAAGPTCDAPGECHPTAVLRGAGAAVVGRSAGRAPDGAGGPGTCTSTTTIERAR